jgi:hypothetical protein
MREIESYEKDNIIRMMQFMGPDKLISQLEELMRSSSGKDKEDALIYLEFALSL